MITVTIILKCQSLTWLFFNQTLSEQATWAARAWHRPEE